MSHNIPDHIKQAVAAALLLLPKAMHAQEAVVLMYATGLQESKFLDRFQVIEPTRTRKGPARGFWQFEHGGGVIGVMTHGATRQHAARVCEAQGVPFKSREVWARLETDDVLAAAFARLLLWSDPRPLPRVGDVWGAWECYLSTWRPGKPHRRTWEAFYLAAVQAADRRRIPRADN